ncbi:nicotinamide-nucleotide amidohydrolase family protein [Gammaproteobacteria bacterium AB-CW1]|uniref:Nicotinamide-nucleotide amidohydrolase family protein n=2 Tax=Natronospira elongata TaxID=3110268 RepID=A0AAP6JG35_9GAMM|nr:nicotinamide-nucleotide amidohydrolase family protein [Gammaproteobacteria bacterium AB-CW1]
MSQYKAPDDQQLRTLADNLGQRLLACGWRLVLAESCTGGWLAKCLTDVAGSSAWFERGWVSYSNSAKQDMLGVSATLLESHGAVSEAVVTAMARGARRAAGTELALAVSGVAGPDGGSDEKPVGMVCFGLADRNDSQAWTHYFSGDREAIRRASVAEGLRGLIESIPQLEEGS